MSRNTVLLSLLALASCGPSKPPSQPDIVLISIDTLRADHVGAWGSESAATPWMDALATVGTRFERATTVSNNTLPAHVSMMTGQHSHRSGVPRNGHKLGAGPPWLPELLGVHGYETAAFVSASAVAGDLGLSRGFDVYDDTFDVREMDQQQRRAATTVDAALAWLDREHATPVFTWVHLFDPHYPYSPPEPHRASVTDYQGPADGSMEYLLTVWGRMGRDKVPTTAADRARMVELYDAEIAYLDEQLGRLLRAAQARDAFIVLVADHGESLTEHDYLFDHGEFLYQPSLHIPMIMAAPGTWTAKARTSTMPVQTIDIMPTLLSAAGADVPESVHGHDLLPAVWKGETIQAREVAFAESCRPWGIEKRHKGEYQNLYKAQSATRWPYKLIATPYLEKVELYDLSADPGELTDIAAQHPDTVDELATAIEGWRGGKVRIGRPDADNMEQIKALGYTE